MNNYMKLAFLSLSQNESLARSVAAAFAIQLNPNLEELADIRTAISEAVTNAIVHGYAAHSGIVTMQCKIEENVLTFIVEDAGCGIDDVELAMQPFYTSSDSIERSGMGFAVMKAFMDSLEVKSTLGVGTTVIMCKCISQKTEE